MKVLRMQVENKRQKLSHSLTPSQRKWLWDAKPPPLFLFMPQKSTLGHFQGIGAVGFLPGINGNLIYRPIKTHPDLPGKSFLPLAFLVS